MPSTSSSRQSKRRDQTSRHRHRDRPPDSLSINSLNAGSSVTKQPPSFAKNVLLNGAICMFALCLVNTINLQGYLETNAHYNYLRRSLLGPPKLTQRQISQSLSNHLLPVDYAPTETVTTIVWHDHDHPPFEQMLSLYQCIGNNVATDMNGMDSQYGIVKTESARFRFYEAKGTTKDVDLAEFQSGMSPGEMDDLLIVTNEPVYTVHQLFDDEHRGRMFALFSDPVHLTIHRFLGRREGHQTNLLEWVQSTENDQDNILVKKLLGKHPSEKVLLIDLQMAKEFIRKSVVVGLTSEIEESFNRFNVAMGFDEHKVKRHASCLENVFSQNDFNHFSTDKLNQMVPPNSKEWNAIASRNYLDLALYAYVEKLFQEHDGIFNLYPQDDEDSANVPGNTDIDISSVNSRHAIPDFERIKEIESKVMSESPYATPPNIDEVSELDTTDSKVIQSIDNEAVSTANPKSALKRRLADVTSLGEVVDSHSTTPFFWHVPKAGGTAIQNLYWCMGLTLANEVGGNPKLLERKNIRRDVLTVFQPWKKSGNLAKVINVDVTTHRGIANAKKMGFLSHVDQPQTDFVSSSLFHVVSMRLFTPNHKARMFALFRHPVERAVSKFYYLSKATWEPTYDETWANMTLEEWASNDRGENNWLVHHLAGKKHNEPVNTDDLEFAKEMIQTKFIVGLMNQFDESVHRFNLLLGVDENDSKNKQCIHEFVHNEKKEPKKRDLSNRNSYTKAKEGSPAWAMLSEINSLDVELFGFIEEQFVAQRHLLEQYQTKRIIFEQLETQRRVETS